MTWRLLLCRSLAHHLWLKADLSIHCYDCGRRVG